MTKYTLGTIDDYASSPETFEHGHRWGPWLLDANRLCLCRVRDGVDDPETNIYEIDLEVITSPFWLTDWIAQICTKNWATPEVVGHLAIALNALFRPRDRMRDTVARFDPVEVLRPSINRDWG